MKRFWQRLCRLWQLSVEYDRDAKQVEQHLTGMQSQLNEHTVVHADVHWRGQFHQVVVIGRYHNRDYVRVFELEADSWFELIDFLKQQEPKARVGRIDSTLPSVSAVYPHERW